MPIRYQQPGAKMTWTNTTGGVVAVNTLVVIGGCLAIALGTIAIGAVGEVALEGVFSGVAKTTGTAWVQGDVLDWDISASKFQKGAVAATGDITSAVVAFEAAALGDTIGTVKLTNPGAVT